MRPFASVTMPGCSQVGRGPWRPALGSIARGAATVPANPAPSRPRWRPRARVHRCGWSCLTVGDFALDRVDTIIFAQVPSPSHVCWQRCQTGQAVKGESVRIETRVVCAVAVLAAVCAGAPTAQAAAPPGPWDAFNLSPASRTVQPVAVFGSSGAVGSPDGVLHGQATTLGPGAYVSLDFGKEVGGFTRLHFAAASSPGQNVGLTYSELSTYVSPARSDASNGASNDEPPLQYATVPGGSVDTHVDVPAGLTPPSLTGASWIWTTPGSNSSAATGTV